MRRVLTALIFAGLSAPAFAAGAPAAPAQSAKGDLGSHVEMPYLMAPMTDADGKLSGYAYISTILTATSEPNALAVRDKLAFIQDALVRDVNGASIAKAGDPTSVDQKALLARMTADATKVMGPGKVASLAIVTVQIAPLHPTQTEIPAADAPADATPPPPVPAAKPVPKPKTGG